MPAALFTAGLGDVIRSCYLNAAYQRLSDAREPLPVIVASHNPYSVEIFRHHRNTRHLLIHDLGREYHELHASGLRGATLNRALCALAGVDHRDVVRDKTDLRPPAFDAPDDIDSSGHVVFQPFAGNASLRSLPQCLIHQLAQALQTLPWPVFVVTRSYVRLGRGGSPLHEDEDAGGLAGGNIRVLNDLSVPATLNLVKNCRAFVGSWSSLLQAAWLERKPVAVYCPDGFLTQARHTDYGFGLGYSGTLALEFSAASNDAAGGLVRHAFQNFSNFQN